MNPETNNELSVRPNGLVDENGKPCLRGKWEFITRPITLEEVPIKSSAELENGMVVVYKEHPEKRWLIRGNHRESYTVDRNGKKLLVSNLGRNKIMISDFDDPESAPALGCFDITPEHYKVYRPQNTPTGDTE